jgi:uncharacterized protein (DUF433 family)
MAKTRIKKPVRKKKKSDYPGEMSFRKALGMNPTYYQEGGKLYYQENIGKLPPLYVDPNDPGDLLAKASTQTNNNFKKTFPRNISKAPSITTASNPVQKNYKQYEDRIRLSTPKHDYHMNLEQYSRLLPTDSIPQQGNFLYRTNRQDGGKLYYQEKNGLLPTSTGFNFSGYLDGNQGLIPDYNNIPTKSHISNILLNTPLPVVKPADKPKDKPKKSDVLDLDNSLDYLVNTRGGTRDLWGNMADTIGYHESAHTMDPGQLQKGGGPGRGIFQFEAPSLVTAQNRYKRIADRLKLKTDPEILKAKSAIELSPEQQYSLFLINLSESKAKLKDYADKKLSLENLWLQGHKNKEAKGDRGSFRTSVQKAKKDSIKSGYSTLKEFGGNLRYARGGSLTSAQDTAQAADLNKDIMRKDIKKASVGEDFLAGLYGVGEGLLDTVTFGLTDELTDAGFKALQAGAGHDVNSVEAKRQAGIKGWGNVGGAVGAALINPASAFSAGQEGLEGIGQGIQGINPEDKTLQAVGKGVEGLGNIQLPKGMESMEGMSKLFMARNGGKFKYGYRGGGHMLNQNMGLTEIDGPSHEEGGVTLPNNGGRPDVEVEGPETIYTPENYVMSEKMKASLEALEFAGITGKSAKSLAGKSYADLSKMIKSKAGDKLRPNDPLSKKMLDKEMKRLMRAHEYDREAKRMQDEAMRTQMMGGSNVVAETPEQRAGGYNMYPNAQSIEFPGSGPTSVVPTYNNDPIMVTGADGSQQMLTDEPIETEAPFIEEKMAQGGKMIKRADGSYSRRGLWDNIRANRGSGKKPTKQMLEQEAKIKAAEKAYGGYYADGGSFNNPGFRALPSYVQAKIKSNMALGGDMAGLGMEDESLMQGASSFLNPITQTLNNVADIESQENEYQMQLGGYMGDYISDDDTMEYGQGGYTVRKSNDRKGKTHVVTGPDGTKKYFGDPKLGERGKSKYGKDAFYARHKKNLAKNPYFRAYARATWEDGGYMNMLNSNVDMADMETPMYAYGGPMMYAQGGIHIDPAKRGTFKAQASRMGMGVQEAARTILNAPEGKYSPAMRKKANFARNFAKEYGGYYQMGGEMMQAPQQGQPQGGGEEQILQQVAQMLQQGMSPEEIVGQLVQMGVPQEQAIQVVQMVVQQMQGQQQAPQEAPQQAPPMMRGGGYMYQMGGEMAPQQAPQQQAPQQQAQGGEEQIVQAIMQMLQQGMQPEEIVGELVKMGLPQEAAIQAVQMVMQQSQQGQQQQPQPPYEQGMMGSGQPPMRYGGRYNPLMRRNGGKLYYQEKKGFIPNSPQTLQNMLDADLIESGIYKGPDATAIGNQANANANVNINTNANTGVEPKGYSGLLPDEGYAAINKFENTMGTYDAQGNPTSMNMPEGYSKTGGNRPEAVTETEKYINNTIGKDTWNSLPDDIKTLWYDASFNSTDNKEYFLRALAQAVQDSDPNFQYPQNIGYTDNDYKNYRNNLSDQQALQIIKNADFKKNDVTGNFINILNQQRESIGNRSGFPKNYMPTFNRRAIDVYNNFQNLNSNQPSNPQLGNTTPAATTQSIVIQPNTASQTAPGTGVLLNPTQIGLRNFNQPTGPGKDEKYTPWTSNYAPIVAGGLASSAAPLANIVASYTAKDTRAASPLKFERPGYEPVALARQAGNQALANTREALRRGAPTQGSYLSNLAITAPSMGVNVGKQVAEQRANIDSKRGQIQAQEQIYNDRIRQFNILNQAKDEASRNQLRMQGAAGLGDIGQGVITDAYKTRGQEEMLRALESKDFSPFKFERDAKGRWKQVLSPRGAAYYQNSKGTNQVVTDSEGNKYEVLPNGTIRKIN